MLNKWIATTDRRIITKAKSAIINHRIESAYQKRKKLVQHQRIELRMLAKQHAAELARMDKQIANREANKHRLNGAAFANERGAA